MASGNSGRSSSASKGFDFATTDDILCSYEDYGNNLESSNGNLSDPGVGSNSGKEFHKTRMARTPMFPTSTNISPGESLNNEVIASVERTMKKYTENIMRFLEGISSRLSQLELYCYNLDKSIGEMRSDLIRDHEEADTKLKSLEKHLQEVHRSVQILRDKQELADTQKELAKLQLAQKEPSSSAGNSQKNEEKTISQASDTKNTENSTDVRSQQLALALPSQQQPIQPQGVASQQSYYPQPSQIPNQPPQSQYLTSSPYQTQQASPQPAQPQANQYQQQWPQQAPQQVTSQPAQPQANQPSQYQQQWPQQAPQQPTSQPAQPQANQPSQYQQQWPQQAPQQPTPQPAQAQASQPPQYQQQWPQQPSPQPAQAQANQPPQYQQQWPQQAPHQATPQPSPMQSQIRPSASNAYSPYLPNQPANTSMSETLPNSMPMQVPYSGIPQPSGSCVDASPYGYGGPVRPIQPPPQQLKSQYGGQNDGYTAPSRPHASLPSGNSYMMYQNEGGRASFYPPPSGPSQGPPSNAGANMARPQLSRGHAYNELIDKLVGMGYRGDHVASVIQRLEENGQSVDFNAVLDILNGHPSGGSQRGWSG